MYNAIAPEQHQFFPTPQDPPYLAFLGRMSPEKGPHQAIAIARRVGIPLKMAGKVDPVDQAYFERDVQPHIDGEFIQFLGEANHPQKNALLGGAIAMLFPITWEEPFGLVMIESMATGTPVIALKLGSTTEVIAHGRTGYVVETPEDCATAIGKLDHIDRHACRQYVEQRFSVAQMVNGYEAVYHQLLQARFAQNGRAHGPLELMAG